MRTLSAKFLTVQSSECTHQTIHSEHKTGNNVKVKSVTFHRRSCAIKRDLSRKTNVDDDQRVLAHVVFCPNKT